MCFGFSNPDLRTTSQSMHMLHMVGGMCIYFMHFTVYFFYGRHVNIAYYRYLPTDPFISPGFIHGELGRRGLEGLCQSHRKGTNQGFLHQV